MYTYLSFSIDWYQAGGGWVTRLCGWVLTGGGRRRGPVLVAIDGQDVTVDGLFLLGILHGRLGGQDGCHRLFLGRSCRLLGR